MIDDPRTAIPALLTEGRARAAWRSVALGAGLVLAAAAAIGLARWRSRSGGERRAGVAWAELSNCLLAPAPAGAPLAQLGAPERLRLTALSVLHRPQVGAPWPGRCARHARALREALRGLSPDRSSMRYGLYEEATDAYLLLSKGNLPRTPGRLFTAAAGAELPEARAGGPAPPVAQRPLEQQQLRPLWRAGERRTVAATSGSFLTGLRFVTLPVEDDGERPSTSTSTKRRLCELAADGRLACTDLSADIPLVPGDPLVLLDPPQGQALALDDARVLASVGPARGVYRGRDGALLAAGGDVLFAGNGAAFPEGFAVVAWSSAGNHLITEAGPAPLPELAGARHVAQYGELVLWVAGPVLRAMLLQPGPGHRGPVAEVAQIQGGDPRPRLGCRTAAATMVRFDDNDDRLTLLIVDRAGHFAPVTPDTRVPASALMTCRDREATFTWRDRAGIHQVRCNPNGCLTGVARGDRLPRSARLADLDGRLLAVWTAAGQLWMRHAALADLDGAPDSLILDDRAHGGPGASIAGVFAHERRATILLRATGGDDAYLVSIGADGQPQPTR